MHLDSTDKQLLQLLQSNCKQTTKALSLKLNLSVTAVYERIKKLEKNNIISKYVALLNNKNIDKNFMAFCHVKLERHSQDYIKKFESEIVKIDEVLECYHISGDYDYLLKVVVNNMETFRAFMISKLTNINHISSTHSMFVINQAKNTTQLKL